MANPQDLQANPQSGTKEAVEGNHFEVNYADFLSAAESLQSLLELENDLLRQGRRGGLGVHEQRKKELTEELRKLFPLLLERPEFLQGQQNARCNTLIEQVKCVQRLLSENRMLLNAAKVATFRRIEAAVEARRQQIESGRRYGDLGEAEDALTGPIPSALVSRKI